MPEVRDSIVVRAPVERTYRYLTDYSHALDWMEGMVEFAPLGAQTTGVGARARATEHILGRPVSVELRIVEQVENQKLVSVSSGLVHSIATWLFEPIDGGTRVTFHGDYRVMGLPKVPFADSILKSEVGSRISRSLRNLKARLEAEPAAT